MNSWVNDLDEINVDLFILYCELVKVADLNQILKTYTDISAIPRLVKGVCLKNSIKAFQFLVQYKIDTELLFSTACRFSCVDMVKIIINDGLDNMKIFQIGLSIASLYNRNEIVRYLVGIQGHSRFNVLILDACNYPNLDMVKFLVETNSDVNERGGEPLYTACSRGNINIVKFLIESNADVTKSHMEAPKWSDVQTIEVLLKHLQFKDLPQKHREYLVYFRWRRVYLRRWIRRVLIPLYFSPENRGGTLAKHNLQNLRSPTDRRSFSRRRSQRRQR